MSDNLDALRAKYKEVMGKNAFNGWDAGELRKRIDEHVATSADGAATGNEPGATTPSPDAEFEPVKTGRKSANDSRKEAGKAPIPAAPYPTQDDLDAMRAGTYQNRELKSR